MKTTFLIKKEDIEKKYECTLDESILSLKERIIQDFALTCKYIDIDFLLDRPIRTLGKFNVEAGILPRPLDIYKLERFGIGGRTIHATFNEVKDYTPHLNSNTRIRTRSKEKKEDQKGYDLTSNDDFPKLS